MGKLLYNVICIYIRAALILASVLILALSGQYHHLSMILESPKYTIQVPDTITLLIMYGNDI